MNKDDERCIIKWCNDVIAKAGGTKKVRKIRKGYSSPRSCPISNTIRAGLPENIVVSTTGSRVKVYRNYGPCVLNFIGEFEHEYCVMKFVEKFDNGLFPEYEI